VLEPKTAVIFRDKSVPWLPIDTSYCSWVATANNVEAIHPAIRSRFTEIEVTSPTEDALANLVQRLYSSLLEEFSLSDRLAKELTDVQTKALIGGSVRDAKRILRSAIGLALRLNKREITVEAVVLRAPRQRIGFF
jgi:AAA+ superfamily predicted ATPase